jgi:hypothetical protein
MHQLGLDFAARAAAPSEDPGTLVDFLRGKGWLTAEQLGLALGWSDRRVRKAASQSDQVISYPGSPGYKLIGDCSKDEYLRYRNVTRHQAREMIGRVMRTDRQFFGHVAALP